jgi:hypothetical protein
MTQGRGDGKTTGQVRCRPFRTRGGRGVTVFGGRGSGKAARSPGKSSGARRGRVIKGGRLAQVIVRKESETTTSSTSRRQGKSRERRRLASRRDTLPKGI